MHWFPTHCWVLVQQFTPQTSVGGQQLPGVGQAKPD